MELSLNISEICKVDDMYMPLNCSIFGYRKCMKLPCLPLDGDSKALISNQMFCVTLLLNHQTIHH